MSKNSVSCFRAASSSGYEFVVECLEQKSKCEWFFAIKDDTPGLPLVHAVCSTSVDFSTLFSSNFCKLRLTVLESFAVIAFS